MLVEALLAIGLAAAPAPPPAPSPAVLRVGRSGEGRALLARRHGPTDAAAVLLAIGSIHGDEPGGHDVVAALRRLPLPRGVAVWTVRSLNPDGDAVRRRGNARGVDLNRNFPHRWRMAGRRGDRYWPGPGRGSEPETRALMRLVVRLAPDLTVHYHQPYGEVVRSAGADPAVLRAYAAASGLPLRRLPAYRGTAAGWQNARRPGSALVVELPGGAVAPAAARRQVHAALAALRVAVRPSTP